MNITTNEVAGWETSRLTSIKEILDILANLRTEPWIVRGQSKCFGTLFPKIDRTPFNQIINRTQKIKLERRSIELFQSESNLVGSHEVRLNLNYDMNTLMVLQHYDVPTRLLDWSLNPYVAAYFSINENENCDGEIWSFEDKKYLEQGNKQWEKITEIPIGSDIKVRYDVAFDEKTPEPDFFMCVYNYLEFMRLSAQAGLFSMTARFGQDHAESIRTFFEEDRNYYHRFIINSDLKLELRQVLKEDFGICQESLFPDTALAAKAVKEKILNDLESYLRNSNT